MANLFTQSEVESILGLQPGQATGGYAQRLKENNPAIRQAFEQAAQQRIAQNQAAMTDRSGVMPVTIEPLHQYERIGLQRLGEGITPTIDPTAQRYLDMFGKYADEAAGFIRGGAAPVTGEEITATMQPYNEAVTERAVGKLSSDAQKMREQIIRRMGSDRPNANFGDLFGAQRMADIDEQFIESAGDLRTTGAAQSWQDAMKRAFANRELRAGGGTRLGQVATGATQAGNVAQNVSSQGFLDSLNSAVSQIGAGTDIRSFNQQATDKAFQNMIKPDMFENELTDLASRYGATPDTYSAQPINQGADLLRGLGGLAQEVSKLEW